MSACARVSSDGGEPSSASMMMLPPPPPPAPPGAAAFATGVGQSDSIAVLYPPLCQTPFNQ